jgi:hypothetical protein
VPSWRNAILKTMLGALALTAAAGVLCVIVQDEVMWRIAATTFVATVASVLMLWNTKLLDDERSRSAGLAGAAGIVVEFILFLILTWDLGGGLPFDETEVLGTAGMVAIATIATMAFLKMLGSPATRVTALAGLAVTAASCGTALVAVWWPRGSMTGPAFWDVIGSLWGTAWAVGLLGVLAAAALAGAGTDRRHWRWAGVAAAAAAIAFALVDIWAESERFLDVLAPLVAVATWVGLAIPLLRIELADGQRWLRTGTLVAGGAAAGLWVISAWGDFGSEALNRAGAASAIPAACGTLALVIIARLRRRVDAAVLPRELRSITLYCPRCSRKQTQALGPGACAACGLRIEVKAEQPACSQCGYLLYGVGPGRCPECGTERAAAA